MPIEDAVRKSLKDTLRDMQLDFLDLYYMPADRFNSLKVPPQPLRSHAGVRHACT